MIQKLVAAFCICTLLLTGISVPAASQQNLVINGDFEVLKQNGTLYGWSYNGDTLGMNISDATVQDGQYALHYKSASPVYVNQTISGIVDTCTYTLGAWVYMVKGTSSSARIKLEFLDANKKAIGEETYICNNISTGKWAENSFSLIPPQGAAYARILLRYQGSSEEAEFLWDSVTLMGEMAEGTVREPLPESYPLVKIYPDAPEVSYTEENSIELLNNGDFEMVGSNNKPVGWQLKQTGGTIDCTAEAAVDGRIAVAANVTTDTTGTFLYQGVPNLRPCHEYKFTGNIRVVGGTGTASVRIVWRGETGTITEREVPIEIKAADVWQPFEFMLTAPYETKSVQLWLRTKTTKRLLWDGISFRGVKNTDAIPENMELRDTVPGTADLFVNGGIEEMDGEGAAGWEISGTTWNKAITTETVYNGSRSLVLSSDSSSTSPYVQQIVNVTPGCVYQLSMALNIKENYASYGLMPELHYYSSEVTTDENKIAFETAPSFMKELTYGEWRVRAWEFVPPAGTTTIKIWIRWFRQGTCFVDDISLRMVSRESLDTNDFFYYSDLTEGIATAKISEAAYGTIAGHTVDFALKDGETVLHEKKGADISGGETKYYFPVSAMAEKEKEYTVEAVFCDGNGVALNTLATPVYKYDRPAVLNKEGVYIVDGEPLNPVIGYHVPEEKLARVAEIGVNVVQTWNSHAEVGTIEGKLDAIHANGMKALVSLYPDGTAAGSETNIERTKRVVNAIKDHPAVFAYAIIDEPYGGTQRTLQVDDDIFNSYKEIRAIDPVHPVFITDAKFIFEPIQKRTDIMNLDIYPKGDNGGKILTEFPRAVEASYNNDSLMMITQMSTWQGYFPTPDVLRSWIYQGFFAGAKSTGFYAFDVTDPGSGLPVEDAPVGEAVQAWSEKEADIMFDCFVNKKYPFFSGYTGTDCAWRIFLVDGELYVFAVNCYIDQATKVSIPLTSENGRVNVNGFTGILYGGGEAAEISAKDTLELELTPGQAVFYKLTPSEAITDEMVRMTSFTDIDSYSWAKEQIAALERDGVVNSKGKGIFAPGENITRGDFAMFLIRALDLRSYTAVENFTDVGEDAYYAKEIGIGKALGLFKGMGDGTYGPETPISRQDLMVICARAMRLVSKLDAGGDTASLAAFTDGGSIAEYAAADVAAMTAGGIIVGNGDGTVNPLGNTTRAEAAVIMHRICK
ncbi:MAG: hypothetical protein E7390_01155 [Ruminococcaceae bacterium]|nr:hypothetical protein [Oscillospiraceae bacterium]